MFTARQIVYNSFCERHDRESATQGDRERETDIHTQMCTLAHTHTHADVHTRTHTRTHMCSGL